MVRTIAERDGITEGMICVLSAVEPCGTFRMVYGEGRSRLQAARRKCLCLYYYYRDREFGQMYVRIQAWFPFMILVSLNGHDWLARKMGKHGIGYQRIETVIKCPYEFKVRRMGRIKGEKVIGW